MTLATLYISDASELVDVRVRVDKGDAVGEPTYWHDTAGCDYIIRLASHRHHDSRWESSETVVYLSLSLHLTLALEQ